ncbi:single insulin-like growth factor-binding domain protein-1 [Macrobrachium rosenbergii]|uniref:single insulin-like growth factor-binding domain protein-1 n=1 Tax=Macrobrachium rosenbergii TaxID=79674 RepID=UPI0034D485C5
MKAHLLVAVTLCLAFIHSSWSFFCPCLDYEQERSNCPPEKTLVECPHGATFDPCYCCPNARCKNGLGDRCGGDFDLDGPCGEEFVCLPFLEGDYPGLYETCQLEKVTTTTTTTQKQL